MLLHKRKPNVSAKKAGEEDGGIKAVNIFLPHSQNE